MGLAINVMKFWSDRDTDNEIQGKNRIETYASHLEEVVSYYQRKKVYRIGLAIYPWNVLRTTIGRLL